MKISSQSVAPAISTHGNKDYSKPLEAPFQLECGQCHDPHSTDIFFDLREYVLLTSKGDIKIGPVSFTALTGLNSFDDGVSEPDNRICVACHSNPNNPGYPMVYHAGGDHGYADYSGQNCLSCHPHDADGDPTTVDGFMPIPGANPPLPSPPTMPVFKSATFQFNEPAGSAIVASEPESLSEEGVAQQLLGAVHNPAETILGDGYFHGDGLDNYISFENTPTSLQASTSLAIDVRLKPTGLPRDTGNYAATIFDRGSEANYRVSLWRNNSWPTYNAPLTAASIALWIKPVDAHTGAAWKPVLTDYELCPIVSDHWYQVQIRWDSAKPVGIPADIYVDDQGPGGDNLGETWTGNLNCTNSAQTLVPAGSRLFQGDRIQTGNGSFALGVNAANHNSDLFEGLIDWITIGDWTKPTTTPGTTTLYLPLIINSVTRQSAAPPPAARPGVIYLPVIVKNASHESDWDR